jgi:AraC family transcriptional regulator
MLIHRVQVPPHSEAATRTARDVLEERSDLRSRVELDPEDAATRSESSWRGLAAEVLEITATRAFKCGFSASSHLLTAVDRGALTHGETRIGGVVASTRRDIGRTLSFIPKGYTFQGTFMPRILPRCGNLYIDPALSLADPQLQFADIEFEPRLFFDAPDLWATAGKILRLVEEDDDDRLYAETLTAQLAIELVRFSSRGARRPLAEHGGLAEWQRRAVIEFINDNLDRNISLKELASLVRLSPNHLCKAFARTMGMPPHQYHRRQRIERAKLLLADTRRSITDIVSATGYTASSNFATAFRRVTGLSPREFRRSLI